MPTEFWLESIGHALASAMATPELLKVPATLSNVDPNISCLRFTVSEILPCVPLPPRAMWPPYGFDAERDAELRAAAALEARLEQDAAEAVMRAERDEKRRQKEEEEAARAAELLAAAQAELASRQREMQKPKLWTVANAEPSVAPTPMANKALPVKAVTPEKTGSNGSKGGNSSSGGGGRSSPPPTGDDSSFHDSSSSGSAAAASPTSAISAFLAHFGWTGRAASGKSGREQALVNSLEALLAREEAEAAAERGAPEEYDARVEQEELAWRERESKAVAKAAERRRAAEKAAADKAAAERAEKNRIQAAAEAAARVKAAEAEAAKRKLEEEMAAAATAKLWADKAAAETEAKAKAKAEALALALAAAAKQKEADAKAAAEAAERREKLKAEALAMALAAAEKRKAEEEKAAAEAAEKARLDL